MRPGDIVEVRMGIDGVVEKGARCVVRAVGYGETGRDILVWPPDAWFWEEHLALVEGIDKRLEGAPRPPPVPATRKKVMALWLRWLRSR